MKRPGQLDLPSLTPLAEAGYGRLQLGADGATSVALLQVVYNYPHEQWQQILHWEAPGHRRRFILFNTAIAIKEKFGVCLVCYVMNVYMHNHDAQNNNETI